MSNTPQISFAGFTDDWEKRKLGDLMEITSVKRIHQSETNNLEKRMQEHCSGKGADYTKKHKPVKLVYVKGFETEAEAVKHEKYLKSGAGREWLKNYLREESVQND